MTNDSSEEDRLQKELEFLYKKVASQDHSDADADSAGDLAPYYSILMVKPDAPMADITASYEKLIATWDENRFRDVPSWEGKSEEKRKEVKEAYEKILLYRGKEPHDDFNESYISSLQHTIISTDFESSQKGVSQEPRSHSTAKKQSTIIWLWGISTVILLMSVIFLIKPALYHYSSIRSGDKVYPIRVNRLTSTVSYYNGREWLENPSSIEMPSKIQETPESKSSTPPVKEGTAATTAIIPKEMKGVAEQPARGSKDPISSSRADLSAGPVKAEATDKKNQKAPVMHPTSGSKGDGAGATYAIQIKSFRDLNEAKAFLLNMKTDNAEAYIRQVTLKDNTEWYRILMGHFPDRNKALAHMKDKKMTDVYPGCFIQLAGKAK
ncbi:MAG: SPOR domain-containing protein [Syntrophales bacterium]|nr:SPOR domain-containing protein [Syntrophales bacterium]